MRLDFFQFVVTGPSTSTITQTGTVGGVLTPANGIPYSVQTQCLWVHRTTYMQKKWILCNFIPQNLFIQFTLIFRTDTFTVTGPATGLAAPPRICGTNTGEHSKLQINDKTLKLFKLNIIPIEMNPVIAYSKWFYICLSVCRDGR